MTTTLQPTVPAPRTRGLLSRRTVRLADGTCLTLRPLRDGETTAVQTLFDALSPRSRRLRFLAATPRLSGRVLDSLARVDQVDRLAWVAEVDGAVVGIARAYRSDAGTAEVALAVADRHQGRGISRQLLTVLAEHSRHAGLQRWTWLMSPDNDVVQRLVRSLGGRTRCHDGVVEATVEL